MTRDYDIIAETAFTHEGDLNYLYRQIEAAKEGHCDYIKFQILIDPENYYSKDAVDLKQIRSLVFSESDWSEAVAYAKSIGLRILALPLTPISAGFCKELGNLIEAFEIHSVCFLENELISVLSNLETQIFLGVGGRYAHEVEDVIGKLIKATKIVLMHGFQSFPTTVEDVNLKKIGCMSKLFPVLNGYADHTGFSETYQYLINYAYILGARYFEKHLILEKGSKRIDYEAAISKDEFFQIRQDLDQLILQLGDGNGFKLNDKELEYRNRNKKIVTIDYINKGETFTFKNIGLRISPETSDFEQNEIKKLYGRIATTSIAEGTCLRYYHIG